MADALAQVEAFEPDLLIVDISLKEGHGIDLVARVKEIDPRIKMIVWSMYDDHSYAERAFCAGASGYLNKQEPIQCMVEAIHQVRRRQHLPQSENDQSAPAGASATDTPCSKTR